MLHGLLSIAEQHGSKLTRTEGLSFRGEHSENPESSFCYCLVLYPPGAQNYWIPDRPAGLPE